MKTPFIEYFEYNFFMSLMDFFYNQLKNKTINNKQIEIVQSFFDKDLPYKSPAISLEIMYRKNKSIGFGNYYGDIEKEDCVIEIEGTIFEYRVQINVYSNTRGESYKMSSLLDDVLKIGESGIDFNIYEDSGLIKENKLGIIRYDFSSDVKSNIMPPNIVTYD